MERGEQGDALSDQDGGAKTITAFPEGFNDDAARAGRSPTTSDVTAQWFELSPRACFVLERDGRIRAANHEGRRMLATGSGATAHDGGLTFHCEASQRLLGEALAAVCDGTADRVRRLMRADDAEWRMIWIVPADDRSAAFVTVSQSDDDADEVVQLSDAFGLTRTEAGVVSLILHGDAPKQVGAHLGISIHTVRTHLRAIYAKMNVRGLPAAVRLASRLTTA